MRRSTAGLALAVACLAGLPAPAHAAGTGDVELVPVTADGGPSTSFRVADDEDEIRFELVNLSEEPRTARLYAASAARGDGGGVTVGDRGTADWLQLDDLVVELGPGEARSFAAPLDEGELPRDREQLGAVVLEAVQGSVTVRVATLVTVEPRSALAVPTWLAALALAVLVAVTSLLLLVVLRRRRRDDEAPAETAAA